MHKVKRASISLVPGEDDCVTEVGMVGSMDDTVDCDARLQFSLVCLCSVGLGGASTP